VPTLMTLYPVEPLRGYVAYMPMLMIVKFGMEECHETPSLFCWNFTTVGQIAKPTHIPLETSLPEVGGCTHAYVRLRCLHQSLLTDLYQTFSKLVGFIRVYSNYDCSIEGRFYGNRFVARVGQN